MNKPMIIDFSKDWKDANGKYIFQGNIDQSLYERLISLISAWENEKDFMEVNTSGSTSAPKTIHIKKEWMKASALLTLETLDIKPGQKALLCISLDHIGGIMMLIRAMIGTLQLHILAPSSSPEITESVDFTALVPMQVYSLWQKNTSLNEFGTVIIGGAPLSPRWEHILKQRKIPIYATFGMTETVSHIALKRLDGENAKPYFRCLPGLKASVDVEQKLILDIAHFDGLHLQTNDAVELIDEKKFIWKGRADFMINSGGKKVFPEFLEQRMSKYLEVEFFISSIAHEQLGETIVLCLESSPLNMPSPSSWEKILQAHEIPRRIFAIPEFKRTASGKVLRKESLADAELIWSKDDPPLSH